MEKSKRLNFLDIAKGIAILLMIVGHVTSTGFVKDTIFSFHMPLFIIISGFLYKEKSFKIEIKNLVIKLLIPTMIILIFVYAIKNIEYLGISKTIVESLKMITIGYSKEYNIDYDCYHTGVLWFIYLIIVIKLLFLINKKISKENEYVLAMLVLIETFAGVLIGMYGYFLPWSIDVGLACILFYYIGYILKKYLIFEKICKDKMFLLILVIAWIYGIFNNSIEIAIRNYSGGLFSYLSAIAGSIVILKVSLFIESKFKFLTSILSWCGRNSLFILFGHHIEWELIDYDVMLNFLKIQSDILNKVVLSIIKISYSLSFAFAYANLKKLFKKNNKIDNN